MKDQIPGTFASVVNSSFLPFNLRQLLLSPSTFYYTTTWLLLHLLHHHPQAAGLLPLLPLPAAVLLLSHQQRPKTGTRSYHRSKVEPDSRKPLPTIALLLLSVCPILFRLYSLFVMHTRQATVSLLVVQEAN